MSQPGSPPSAMEERAEGLGIRFTRGRTWTSNSHLGLEAAEFVAEHHPELSHAFHRRMLKGYFDELAEIGNVDAVVAFGAEVGVPMDPLRKALDTRQYERHVDDGITWARQAGISAVPTFIVDEQYAIVGAQPVEVFENVFEQLGKRPRA